MQRKFVDEGKGMHDETVTPVKFVPSTPEDRVTSSCLVVSRVDQVNKAPSPINAVKKP